ncbi:hypothetical protein [Pararhizobium sp.]|uniref:hypothetical protein n=1 Tax=Pararhizobium sp. TaxID=1977563 RepID=UPI003BA903D5
MAQEFPKRIARISAILAVFGSLIWVQWPIDFSRFNAAALVLLIASFMTWVSIELADYKGEGISHDNIMSEDMEKLNKIINVIDRNQFYILKNKAIQTYMDDDDYDGLSKLISFREHDIFPFHNQRIQSLYERFCENSREFCFDFYQLYTSDGRGNSTWRPSGDAYVDDDIYDKVMSKIALLDRKSSKLAELWEEFIKVSRQELKGASKVIERYEI